MSTGGYEKGDRLVWKILWGSLLLLVVTLVGMGLSLALFSVFDRQAEVDRGQPHPMTEFREPPAGPVLLAHPESELTRQRARERVRMDYGWVDMEKGVIRLPIGRAMRLVLREGLPVREGKK